MDAQRNNDEFLDVIHTKVLKYYKVSELNNNLSGCISEIADLPAATVNIRGGLSFNMQCALLRYINQQEFPFVIYGRKFENDITNNNDPIALIVTRA